jgi:FkbM family methyltransferase
MGNLFSLPLRAFSWNRLETHIHFINQISPIEIVYDIGAEKGTWTRNVRRVLRNSKFFCFEANERSANICRKIEPNTFWSILSDSEKIVDFYSVGGSGDSYYPEMSEVYTGVLPSKRKTETLASKRQNLDLPIPCLMKLDTQGSEIDILKGAGDKVLDNVKYIIVESSLYPTNVSSPLIDDYIRELDARNFSLLAVSDFHYARKKLMQVDLLFFNRRLINPFKFKKNPFL